jgi:hypothetical protein
VSQTFDEIPAQEHCRDDMVILVFRTLQSMDALLELPGMASTCHPGVLFGRDLLTPEQCLKKQEQSKARERARAIKNFGIQHPIVFDTRMTYCGAVRVDKSFKAVRGNWIGKCRIQG